MFNTPYGFQYKNNKKARQEDPFLKLHVYKFLAEKEPYIVQVEEYHEHVYAIKFYPKSYEDSPNRYNLRTRAGKASRIFATCIEIMLDVITRDTFASIGFYGAPLQEEAQGPTKRFRIYKRIMESLFSPQSFAHFDFPSSSIYLLANRKQIDRNPHLVKEIESFFTQIFEIDGEEKSE